MGIARAFVEARTAWANHGHTDTQLHQCAFGHMLYVLWRDNHVFSTPTADVFAASLSMPVITSTAVALPGGRRALGEFRQLAHGDHQPCHLAGRAWSAAHRTQPAARQRSLLPSGVSCPRTGPATILAATPGTQRHEHPPRTEATVGTREGFSLGHAYSMFPLSPHIFFHGRAGRRRERETTRPAAPIPKVLASQRPAGTLGGRRGHNAQSARLEVVTCTLSAGSPRSDAYAPQVEI